MKKRAKLNKRITLVVVVASFLLLSAFLGFLSRSKYSAGGTGTTGIISVVPTGTSHPKDEEFTVTIKIDGGGQNFMAFAANVTLTNLTVVSISNIYNVPYWTPPPGHQTSECTVEGDCKPRVDGFLGFSAGAISNLYSSINIYTMTVKGNNVGAASVNISDGQIWQKDTSGGDPINIFSESQDGTYTITGPAVSVSSVTTTKADGYYKAGETVDFFVKYGNTVTVDVSGGVPYIALNAGSSTKATYVSGSGTDTLKFTYTVGDGDKSSKLDYSSIEALNLNGGTIKNSADQVATSNSLPQAGISTTKNIVIDAVKPVITFSKVNTHMYPNTSYLQSVDVADDTALTYSWESSGTVPVSFSSTTQANTSISVSEAGNAVITLTATDRVGNSDSKTINITIHQLADINNDTLVDATDFALILSNWTSTDNLTPANWMADITNNGEVNFDDFVQLLLYWGKG